MFAAAALMAAGNIYATSLFKPFEGTQAPSAGKQLLVPLRYRVITANEAALRQFLDRLGADPFAATITLPAPDGTLRSFRIWKTPMMEEPLLQRYGKDIQTFTATATDDPHVSAKLDFTPRGFHAMVYDGHNTFFIDPYSDVADGYYITYYKRDYRRQEAHLMNCDLGRDDLPEGNGHAGQPDGGLPPLGMKQNGATRRTYRLALSCTGEYAVAVGGSTPTTPAVLGAMTTSMNRVNGIYERELGLTMILIGNNDQLVYLNPATDPFSANNNGGILLGQNQSNTNSVIGSANYDIGHIFSTGGGGIAFLGCVCNNNLKARGVTGSLNPVGDPYDVDYVAHEMGHQFGAEHTFNRCSNTENELTAFEPGSGSTIMAYAGICGPINDLQRHSDAYFHGISLDQISDFIASGWGGGCAATAPGNTPPSLPSITGSYTIPYLTPFELTLAAATAGFSDTLNYCWEQWDLGNFQENESGSATFTTGPSFRSFLPTASTTRVFPVIDSIIRNNNAYLGERLPAIARTLHFKATARNIYNGFGGFDLADGVITLDVVNTGDTFCVTSPNLATDTAYAGEAGNITWRVAQTDAAPINAAAVDIFLSVDGGYTYPFTLGTGLPNTGSAVLTMPDTFSMKARVKVKGSGNVFFDISNADFVLYKSQTSIADTRLSREVQVYPNPATHSLTVSHSGAGTLEVQLFSAIGQKVWSGSLKGRLTIPVAALARGLYYLELRDGRAGAKAVRQISLQ